MYVGTHDLGLRQVWDFLTGRLKKDLQFQADEQFMMHDSAVLALAFSRDSELLASGSQDGKIKARAEPYPQTLASCLKPVTLRPPSRLHGACGIRVAIQEYRGEPCASTLGPKLVSPYNCMDSIAKGRARVCRMVGTAAVG